MWSLYGSKRDVIRTQSLFSLNKMTDEHFRLVVREQPQEMVLMKTQSYDSTLIDSPYSWIRLGLSLILSTVGGISLWSSVVVIPEIEVEFILIEGMRLYPILQLRWFRGWRYFHGTYNRRVRRYYSAIDKCCYARYWLLSGS